MVENVHDALVVYLREPSLWAFLLAYVGGLLVSFTPCVYPLVPTTVALVGMRSSGTTGGGFRHALVYVAGMALAYTILGMAAALSGTLFGRWQANPWVYLLMANLCIFMGLAMMGVFNISLALFPTFGQGQVKPKGYGGTFLLGAASSLVIGPCTAPVLAVLLGYVALGQNVILGGLLLFFFSLGMGSLLIVFGTAAAWLCRLPRGGRWLGQVNKIFGLILIGVGEYLLIRAGGLI